MEQEKQITFLTDFFGVIVDEMGPQFFKKQFGEQGSIIKDRYFNKVDIGEISFDEVLRMIAKDYDYKYEDVRDEFYSYLKLKPKTVELLKQIKKKANIVLCSNAGEHLVEDIISKFNLSPIFDKVFISYKYHMAKPDLNFFLLAKNSFPNSKTYYMLDDNMKNLENLGKIDIRSLHFVSEDQLEKDLTNLNLL